MLKLVIKIVIAFAVGFLLGANFAGSAAREYSKKVACQEVQDELLIHISSCGNSVVLTDEARIC